MSQPIQTAAETPIPQRQRDVISAWALIVGALLFLPSGILHPEPSSGSTELERIYSMLVDPKWIPSAALELVAFVCFALAFGRLAGMPGRLGQALRLGSISSAAVAVGAFLYLFGRIGAEPLSRDQGNWFSIVMYATHLVVNPLWGLAVAAIALFGGLSGLLVNRVTLVIGVVGGLAWMVSMLTAPYLNLDDVLFPIAGMLLTVWAIVLGAVLLRRGR